MKLRFYSSFILTMTSVTPLVFAPLAFAGTSEKQLQVRKDVVIQLRSKGYFLNGTCSKVLETTLLRLGLPALREQKSVPGRESFDRSKELADPPVLADAKRSIKDAVKVRATSPKSDLWTMTVSRKHEGVEMTTLFNFHMSKKFEINWCTLDSIAFNSNVLPKQASSQPMVAASCLGFFIDGSGLNAPNSAAGRELVDWAKKDCALGLHYIKSPNELMSVKPTKKASGTS